MLVRHFLREIEREVGPREIDSSALAALVEAEWPGNLRELRNVVRRAAILSERRIDVAALELPTAPRFRIGETLAGMRLAEIDRGAPGSTRRRASAALWRQSRGAGALPRAVTPWRCAAALLQRWSAISTPGLCASTAAAAGARRERWRSRVRRSAKR